MICFRSLISVCACIVASVGCNGGNDIGGPAPPSVSTIPTVAVEFSGRLVNADAGDPIGNVRVSLGPLSVPDSIPPSGWGRPTETATSAVWDEEPLPSITVAPNNAAYVYGPGTATVRARR